MTLRATAEWKRICCAVDLTDASRPALELAVRVARRHGADLWLVHVVPQPTPAASDVLVSSAGVKAVEAQRAADELERWKTDAEHRFQAPVQASLLSGDAAAEILRLVDEEHCDLIVVGTHGRTAVSRLVLGSVAERIVRQARCSVLVARDG